MNNLNLEVPKDWGKVRGKAAILNGMSAGDRDHRLIAQINR